MRGFVFSDLGASVRPCFRALHDLSRKT
jgi:hypothetical protein